MSLVASVGDGGLYLLRSAGISVALHTDACAQFLRRIERERQVALGIILRYGILQIGVRDS